MNEPLLTPDPLLRRHREMLLLMCVCLPLAFLFEVSGDDRVAFSAFPDYPLPPSCGSKMWFGVNCPGCGLTRSVVYLAHGQGVASWRMHRLGILMAAAMLIQFPYRLLALCGRHPLPFGTRFPKVFGYLLIGLLIGNWLFEMTFAG